MKSILENAKTFQVYARIDYCYYAIKQIAKTVVTPRSPIVKAIDKAVKYNPDKENAKALIPLFKEIIKSKKIIEADYSKDKKMLKELIRIS
jgi:hypothetical protein